MSKIKTKYNVKYPIRDKVSGLAIYGMSDAFIEEMAIRQNKSCLEIVEEINKQISKEGLRYFIPRDKKEIIVIGKYGGFKCQGNYFDNYKEALKRISD